MVKDKTSDLEVRFVLKHNFYVRPKLVRYACYV